MAGKSFKTFTVKQEKHDAIKLLAESKLDSIANIISKTTISVLDTALTTSTITTVGVLGIYK